MRLTRVFLLSFGLVVPIAASLPAVSFAQQQQQSAGANSEAQFRDWIKSFDADGVKSAIGAVRYDRATDTLTVNDIVFTTTVTPTAPGAPVPPPNILRVGKLTLKSLLINANGVQFASAIAENIGVASEKAAPNTGFSIARLNIGQAFVPTLSTFKGDPAHPVTSQVTFLSVLAKARIGEVEVSKVAAGPNFTIERAALDQITNGSISGIEIEGIKDTTLSVSPEQATSGENGLSIKSITLKNADFDPYIRLFLQTAYLEIGSARPWTNLAEQLAITDVKYVNGPVSFSFANGTISALKVRQFKDYLTELFDRAAVEPDFLQKNPEAATRLSDAVRNSFAFESGTLNDIKFRTPNKTGTANLDLKSASLTNLTANHVDGLQLDTVSLTDSDGVINVRKVALGDVNLTTVAVDAANAAPGQPAATTLPTIGSIVADGFEVRVPQVHLTFEKLDLALAYFINATPTNVKAKLDNLRFSTDQIAIPGLQKLLLDLDYKDIDLSARISGAWLDPESALAFDTIELSGKDMGKLSIAGTISGISRASFENPREVLVQEVAAGGLRNFGLSFENNSLLDRLIREAARQNQKTPDELKKILSTNMPGILGGIPSVETRNKFIFAAVSFINNPQVLQFTSTTPDTTAIKDIIATFAEPAKLPVLLKLDASANQRK